MKTLILFLLLVLIHHFLLTPLIRKRLSAYVGLTFVLLVLFGIWCYSPRNRPDFPPLPQWQSSQLPSPPTDSREGLEPGGGKGPLKPETMKLIIGVLLIGADLGVFFYLEARREKLRMQQLLAENHKQQLESLRYQINPHLFMNTLNNIHALVDIDPEKAKESIEEFSKMMRILLYEGDAPTIPLSKELDFIEHFISLMRLRYPGESVRIETLFPEDRSGVVVPPLLMASFVENAFKHGVSYSAESFIRVKVERQEDEVFFRCTNSSHPASTDKQHGVGLENIRKRLSLLYGNNYTLSLDESDECYDVLLSIPSHTEIIES